MFLKLFSRYADRAHQGLLAEHSKSLEFVCVFYTKASTSDPLVVLILVIFLGYN